MRGIDVRLEAVLEVPDGDAALAGQRLPRALEGAVERVDQAGVVALREDAALACATATAARRS